ncbi:TIGR01777 family oxidoreductase [Pedobacter sp. PWIIR3]
MKQHILITGTTGMIGKRLMAQLLKLGHTVSILSRKPVQIKNVKTFLWDIYKREIDESCMNGVDTIIHLAGEGIADQKWTKERKQQIIDSRVISTELLYHTIEKTKASVKHFIASSATGYYGDRQDELLTEDSDPGEGFLAECCVLWEQAVDKGQVFDMRIVKIRTGFVLGKGDGGLASLDKPIRFFAGAALGSGKQWIPWIHVDDIVNIYVDAVQKNTYSGIFNGCAPFPVTNETLTKAIAKQLHRPVWPINVPEKVLEMILGKMSIIATVSTNTSAQKLLDHNFKFKYVNLEEALKEIYK